MDVVLEHGQRISTLITLGALIFALAVNGCSGAKDTESSELATYKKCLENEASKLLDETGSNSDYANQTAAEKCAELKLVSTT
jgi:hypothetical protein